MGTRAITRAKGATPPSDSPGAHAPPRSRAWLVDSSGESCDDRLVRIRVRQIQDRAEAREEPPAREHEEPEESRRDPELAPAERQPGAGADRGEHDEHALEEDRDETEHGDDHQRRVALRWTAGETLEQIAEGDQPADDEDEPRHRHPRRSEEHTSELQSPDHL